MIKISVVEDEKDASDLLISFLHRFEKEQGFLFDITLFTNPLTFLDDYDKKTDVVFMDILLPDLNGMEACKRLREIDKEVTIIFVTNLASYAIKGYEVEALDFIVKPISYDNFSLKLRRALDRVKANEDHALVVSTSQGDEIVPVSTITYIEVMRHQILIHTSRKRTLETYGTLKNIENQLDPMVFCRCNSCYLVNLHYVQSIKDYVAVVAGDELQISHPKKKEFVSSLNDFLGRGFHV